MYACTYSSSHQHNILSAHAYICAFIISWPSPLAPHAPPNPSHHHWLTPRLQETDLTKSDNETATLEIQISDLQSKLEGLQHQMDVQNAHIEEQNALITQSESEIARNNHLIERKQTQIDQLNKRIAQMMTKTEGVSVQMRILSWDLLVITSPQLAQACIVFITDEGNRKLPRRLTPVLVMG